MRTESVFETTFPMFCVRFLGDRHLIVAGGGGQAKTGVPNSMEIFLFDVAQGAWQFRKVALCSTGFEATMNFDAFPINFDSGRFVIACGQGGKCSLYKTEYDLAKFIDDKLTTESITNNVKNGVNKISLDLSPLISFQTDFPAVQSSGPKAASAEPFQKVVKFSRCGKFLATGGTDGTVRIFSVENMNFTTKNQTPKSIMETKLHAGDIDDLDFSPDSSKIVSAGRDSNAFVISTNHGDKLASLANEGLPPKYRFKFARFLPKKSRENDPKTDCSLLLTVCVPIAHAGGCKRRAQQNTFASIWSVVNCAKESGTSCKLRSKVPLALPPGDAPSCLSISDDGFFVAVGTLGGAVVVFENNFRSDTLQQQHRLVPVLRRPAAHSIFVTALAFVPQQAARRVESPFCAVLRVNRCALVSVSADNCAQWHAVPRRDMVRWPRGVKVATTTLLLLLLYYFMILVDL